MLKDRFSDIDAVIELINNSQKIVILPHDSEDADAVGSSYAMKLVLESMGKNAVCCFSRSIEHRLEFMGSDYILQDEAEKYAYDLCLCLDCGDINRLGSRVSLLNSAKHTVSIDHHETNTMFAEKNIVDANSAATGEILFELFEAMAIKMTAQVAANLYTAISSDSGSFKYSNVSAKTMQIAAKLLEYDIHHADIARKLYDTETVPVMRFKGALMNNIEQYFGGKLCLVAITKAMLDRYCVEERDIGDAVNIARSAEGCSIAVSVRETDEKIKISFRSNGEHSVSEIAAKFGGGGHKMAAGAAQKGKSLEQVKAEVIKACEEVLNG